MGLTNRRSAGKDMNIDYGRYRTKQPSLEEVMYCLEKGGYEDV